MASLTNLALWNYLRKTNPTFASHTSEGTKELFTEKGYEALKNENIDVLNEYFKLSMRVVFNRVNIADVRNPLDDSGLVEVYSTPMGGFTQRMAINAIKPVTPAFKGLKDGDSIDPWVVRKGSQQERFFQKNFDFQNFISLQDFQVKQIFISEYGVSDFVAGIIKQLENSYTVQTYVNTLEALNAGINSVTYPLQDSQKITLTEWTNAASGMPTTAALEEFILKLKDLGTQMSVVASTTQLNAAKFETVYKPSDFVVLMRAGIKNRIALDLRLGAYNPEDLSVPFELREVENFGGLVPKDASDGTLQEVYDQFGAVKGYIDASVTVNGPAFQNNAGQWLVNITSGSTTADTTFPFEPDHWYDPNEDVLAVVAQKGIIFREIQNGLEMRTIYNPRGLYENYWMSSPNNGINYDYYYGLILIKKGEAD